MIILTDVHGCYLTMLALIAQLPPGEKIVIAGDLIDRGPRSKEVVEYCIKNNIQCVRGNHEDMAIDYYYRYGMYSMGLWLFNGGEEALKSYGGKMDDAHLTWMNNLPYILEFPEIKNDRGQHLIVSHAAFKDQDLRQGLGKKDILWNRMLPKKKKESYNVFGHTPYDSNWKPRATEPVVTNYYANVDTAAAYKDGGVMTAIQFPSQQIWQQKNID